MNVNVQFADATQSKVIAVFGCGQDGAVYQNLGTLPDADSRYQAFANPVINPNAAINAQITAIETATQVPRVLREFMMRVTEKDAVATAGNLALDVAYQRVKAVDDQIRALRAQLK